MCSYHISGIRIFRKYGPSRGHTVEKKYYKGEDDVLQGNNIVFFFCRQKDNKILRINEMIQMPLFKDMNCRVFSGGRGCLVLGEILLRQKPFSLFKNTQLQ
jgi:hypothetical protein